VEARVNTAIDEINKSFLVEIHCPVTGYERLLIPVDIINRVTPRATTKLAGVARAWHVTFTVGDLSVPRIGVAAEALT